MRQSLSRAVAFVPFLAFLLISATSVPAPTQFTLQSAQDHIHPADVGITRQTATLTIPAGHKLLLLARVYHDGILQTNALSSFRTVLGAKDPTPYSVSLGLLDPDVLLPDTTNKIKLLLPDSTSLWVTAKDKSAKSAGFAYSSLMQIGHSYRLGSIKIGGFKYEKQSDGASIGHEHSEWVATLAIRIEPMTDTDWKSLPAGAAGASSATVEPVDKFPDPPTELPTDLQ